MTTIQCPLPIDWLDWSKGDRDSALANHLEECAACRETVARLERARSAGLVAPGPKPGISVARRWSWERSTAPSKGDLWLTSSGFSAQQVSYQGLGGLVVLVLNDGEEEEGMTWYDVVPTDADIESATWLHPVLLETETTLEAATRVRLELQIRLAREQLDARIARLTPEGMSTLALIDSGNLSDERFGSPPSGPHDPRLIRDPELLRTIHELSRPYGAVLDQRLAPVDLPAQDPSGDSGVHELVEERPLSQGVAVEFADHEFALAAKSTVSVGEPRSEEMPLRVAEPGGRSPRRATIGVHIGEREVNVRCLAGDPLKLVGGEPLGPSYTPVPIARERDLPPSATPSLSPGSDVRRALEQILEWV